jgi:hypothetical protein
LEKEDPERLMLLSKTWKTFQAVLPKISPSQLWELLEEILGQLSDLVFRHVNHLEK